MTFGAPVPQELDGGGAAAPTRNAGVRSGGWVVRITILVVVLLWLIPTAGVLVTSFRPGNLANSSGWWTALEHPWRASEWT